MLFLEAYGCSTAAGSTTSDLMASLFGGIDHSKEMLGLAGPGRKCEWKEDNKASTHHERILKHLSTAARECLSQIGLSSLEDVSGLGLIFCSTKGELEDHVWKKIPFADPYSPILNDFILEFFPKNSLTRTLSLSCACSSSHAAIALAAKWLDAQIAERVLILSADEIGDFISKGFASLSALAANRVTPFGKDREGLQLGEAAAAILISKKAPKHSEAIAIHDPKFMAEGFAVTRASEEGRGLDACIQNRKAPDLIIAHATGTPPNDRIEDFVFSKNFPSRPLVTGTKWSIGHSLGASGAIDVIAASECLKQQRAFGIANTQELDPQIKSQILLRTDKRPLKNILVSSLGFGGVNAALELIRVDS